MAEKGTRPRPSGLVLVLTAATPFEAEQIDDATALYKPVDFDLLQALVQAQISSGAR